jgi:hypothetical protein
MAWVNLATASTTAKPMPLPSGLMVRRSAAPDASRVPVAWEIARLYAFK